MLFLALLPGVLTASYPSRADSGTFLVLRGGPEHASGEEMLLAQARGELWAGRETAAIPLFREYLSMHPDDRGARLDLARALAWSGRLRESLEAYLGLHARHPGDADALAGIGDILAWSGRSGEALVFYRRALAIDPDREATRASAARLERQERMLLKGDSERFHDSGGTLSYRVSLEILPGEARRSGPVVRILREEISRSTAGSGPSLYNQGAAAGWNGFIAGGLRGQALLGATRSGGGKARIWSETRLSIRTLRRLSLDLSHTFRDRGYDLSSLEAARRGLTGHEISLSGYRSFSAESGLYARIRGGSMSDGNAYRGGDLAIDLTAYSRPESRILPRTRALLSLYAKDHSGESDLYYAARNEWAAAAGLRVSLYQDRRLAFEASGRGGVSGNEYGKGEVLGAGGKAVWTVCSSTILEGGFAYDQSIQASTYIRRVWFLGLGWGS